MLIKIRTFGYKQNHINRFILYFEIMSELYSEYKFIRKMEKIENKCICLKHSKSDWN